MIDEAIILAGGLGTRLRDVIRDVPKPLASVAGRPFLAWLLGGLAQQGIKRVVLATGHLGEQIEASLGSQWLGMTLEYSRESEPLGTGGAIALAAEHVRGEAFFVLNGDTSLHLDYADFDHEMASTGVRLGVALAWVPDTARYGAVRLEDGRVAGFTEKTLGDAGFINAGVYRLRRSLLTEYAKTTPFSFERDVLVPAVACEPVMGYTRTDGFIDIGVPDDYRRAQQMFDSASAHAS